MTAALRRLDCTTDTSAGAPVAHSTTDHLVSLADPKSDFAAENVVPLVYKPAMNTTIINTLNAISARLTTTILLQMDNAVITQHANYSTVAAGFLKAEGLS
jgi:osmoprotectant transport system substrate-binding protein